MAFVSAKGCSLCLLICFLLGRPRLAMKSRRTGFGIACRERYGQAIGRLNYDTIFYMEVNVSLRIRYSPVSFGFIDELLICRTRRNNVQRIIDTPYYKTVTSDGTSFKRPPRAGDTAFQAMMARSP
jgi:hypothetical protein